MINIKLRLAIGSTHYVVVRKQQYTNYRIALEAVTAEGEYFCDLTSNIDAPVDDGCAAIKDYSEHEGFLQQLIDQQIVNPPHAHVRCGWVTFPICRIKI